MKTINHQLDIKLGQFNQEELNIVLTKIKSRKATGLNEIPPEILRYNISYLKVLTIIDNHFKLTIILNR